MESNKLDISSTANPRVKAIRALNEARERRRSGDFLIEGSFELSAALQANIELVEVFLCPELSPPATHAQHGRWLSLAQSIEARGLRLTLVSKAVMQRMSYREHPDEALALARQPDFSLETLKDRIELRRRNMQQATALRQAPLATPSSTPLVLLAAEALEKPGNIGALLRSADASGADGCILCDARTDFANPNVVRAGKSIVCHFPCAETQAEKLKAWMDLHNIVCLPALVEGELPLWELANYILEQSTSRRPQGYLILLGAEHEGLSSKWRPSKTPGISIPMFGKANSLNVAQAGTLILYELRRILSTRP